MKRRYAGLHYWLLFTGIWLVGILFSQPEPEPEFTLLSMFGMAIGLGYISAMIMYNFEDQFRFLLRKIFTSRNRFTSPSRRPMPKWKFRIIPDLQNW
jgi:hypothetical protein